MCSELWTFDDDVSEQDEEDWDVKASPMLSSGNEGKKHQKKGGGKAKDKMPVLRLKFDPESQPASQEPETVVLDSDDDFEVVTVGNRKRLSEEIDAADPHHSRRAKAAKVDTAELYFSDEARKILAQEQELQQKLKQVQAVDDVDQYGRESPVPALRRGASKYVPRIPLQPASQQPINASSQQQPGPAVSEPVKQSAPEPRLIIICQYHGGSTKIRLKMNEPFSKLIKAFKTHALDSKLTSNADKIVFKFDGDKLDPEETPAGLDFEGGEKIDVIFQK